MQYTLKAAIARLKGREASWSEVDLSTMDINQIYKTYSKVYLTLTHTAFPQDVYLDMDTARSQIGAYLGSTKTIPDWLVSNGNQTLPTISMLPDLLPNLVHYGDAWRAGYTIEPVDYTRHINAEIPHGDKNDLIVVKPGVDFMTHWRHCMVTVNGLFHRPFGSPQGLYVIDGGRSGRIANNNHVGILSFKSVAPLTYIPIDTRMVYKASEKQKLRNTVHIKLPMNVENKTVMLVLGGYLHVLDGSYKIVGERTIAVDVNNLLLPERLYQSGQAMDLSPLRLMHGPGNEKQYLVEDMYSDRALLAYFTLPQSFVVVADMPDLFVRKHLVEKTGLPGRFYANSPEPRLPLFSALGRLMDYHPKVEDRKTVLACDTVIDERHLFNTHGWQAGSTVGPTPYPYSPSLLASAYQLEIGRYT